MRKLVAALACRNTGSRLYGKPMQNIGENRSILDELVNSIKKYKVVKKICLGVAKGSANIAFKDYAIKNKLNFIFGDEIDVLSRLVKCGTFSNATDILRITSENPFVYLDNIDAAWKIHKQNNNDLTATDGGPLGTHFEIFKLDTLKISHKMGSKKHRSEHCDAYVMDNLSKFKVQILELPKNLLRSEYRLTVDNPEDLILCRAIYKKLKKKSPNIPLEKIINFLDKNSKIANINFRYPRMVRIWPKSLYI
jgi:spore coat polysaccharide biosynthesis protein SpsF